MKKEWNSRKKWRLLGAVIGLVFLLIPAPARAEEDGLTLEAAIQRALARNERALAADQQLNEAEARVTRPGPISCRR